MIVASAIHYFAVRLLGVFQLFFQKILRELLFHPLRSCSRKFGRTKMTVPQEHRHHF